MSGAINIVITNNFALKTDSQDSDGLAEQPADTSDKDSPASNDSGTEELINDDFSFSGVIVVDTVDGVEESSAEETNEAGNTESGEELWGIIKLSTVGNVGSDNISESTDHTDNKRGPVEDVGVNTSSNTNHTSNHGSGNGSRVFSDGSSSCEEVNEDEGDETSTRSSEDSTRSGDFSISVEVTVL